MHIATTRRMSNAKCADARERSQIQGRIGVYSPRLRSDARAMLSLIISSSHMPAYGSLSQQTKIEECLLLEGQRLGSTLHILAGLCYLNGRQPTAVLYDHKTFKCHFL